MSDLLIILVVLGAIIVVSVVVFNWWQEKKYQKRISGDFRPTKRDVLFDDYQADSDARAKVRAKNSTRDQDRSNADPFKNQIKERVEPSLEDIGIQSEPDQDEAASEITQETWQEEMEEKSDANAIDKLETLETSAEDEEAIDEVMEEAFTEDAPISNMVETKTTPVTAKIDDVSLPSALHSQVDLIALLYGSTPITHTSIVSVGKQFKEFTERTFAFGLTAANDWVEISQNKSDLSYTQLAYSLQLADRGGAVTRATLNRFQHMVETIGLDISAHVEWQGSGDPLNNSMTLDQFCIEVDKTVGFHVLANDGATFHATKLRGIAEAQGLSLGADGRFHMFNNTDPNHLEFSLKNIDDNPFNAEMLKSAVMHGVTFQLDIPTVNNSAKVFDEMIAVAKVMAKSMDATIVDDNQKPLGDIHLEKIRQQLKKINAQMIAKGIIPGSPHALRLFS
jgi:FtsZ-interacting cell division protein ZipA